MKKRHGTVLHNARSQKKTNIFIEKTILASNPYKFIWKNGTAPSYKMPEAKKTNTLIEKTILALKTL